MIEAGGRESSQRLRVDEFNADNNLILYFEPQATWIVGFAYAIRSTASATQGSQRILIFMDKDAEQCYLSIDKDSILRFYNGSGTLLAAATKPFPQDNFQFVEVKVTFHPSAGTVQVRVNEETVINATSQVTAVTGVNTADGIGVGPGSADPTGSANNPGVYDDFYVCDTAGPRYTDFLGEIHVEALFPNAAGGSSQWAPVGGSPNYTNVDDAPGPDSDTTYNLGSVIGHRDLYKFPALSLNPGASNEVTAVASNMWIRKDFAGTRTVRPVIALPAGTALGAAFSLDGNYAYHVQSIDEINPVTSVAWTQATMSTAQFGLEIVS